MDVAGVGRLCTAQSVCVTILLVLAGTITWAAVQRLLVTPLRAAPGLFAARFTRLWELAVTFRGDFHTTIVDLHKKHGPVVRLSPNSYAFSSLHDQKVIYNLMDEFPKTEYYSAAEAPGEPNIFSMMDRDAHAQRKKGLAALYSMTVMMGYEPAVDKMNTVCTRKLTDFVRRDRLVNIPEFLQFYAFDVVGEITLGKNFGMMEAEQDVANLNRMSRRITLYQGIVGIIPEWHRWIVGAMSLLRFEDPSQDLDRIARESIRTHRSALDDTPRNSQTDSFVAKLLRLERDGKIEFPVMLDSIETNIAAGSDTIAITLSAALYYLYHAPHALRALRQELDTAAATGRLSNPVTFEEAQHLPYLHAVINESLRLHPAVGYVLPRRVPKGGVELSGIHFPEGTSVGVSAWALHRDPTNYGPDAEEFRPERFLDGRHSNSLGNSFAFGAGSRTCLGKNISLLEMTKLLPEVVRYFDLVFPEDESWTSFSTWFVWPKYRCYVRARDI